VGDEGDGEHDHGEHGDAGEDRVAVCAVEHGREDSCVSGRAERVCASERKGAL
jgi:hypothetical protein